MATLVDYISLNISRILKLARKDCVKRENCWERCSEGWHCDAKEMWSALHNMFDTKRDISMFNKNELTEVINLLGPKSNTIGLGSLRSILAWNSSCSESILIWLIEEAVRNKNYKTIDYETLECAIWNKTSDSSVLQKIWTTIKEEEHKSSEAKYYTREVKRELARKEKTPTEILRELLKESDEEIAEKAKENLTKQGFSVSVKNISGYFPLSVGIKCRIIPEPENIQDETIKLSISKLNSLGLNAEPIMIENRICLSISSKDSNSELYVKQGWCGGGFGPVMRFLQIVSENGMIVDNITCSDFPRSPISSLVIVEQTNS